MLSRRKCLQLTLPSRRMAGALWQELCREDAMAAVEAAALEPLEHLTLAELNSRKVGCRWQAASAVWRSLQGDGALK